MVISLFREIPYLDIQHFFNSGTLKCSPGLGNYSNDSKPKTDASWQVYKQYPPIEKFQKGVVFSCFREIPHLGIQNSSIFQLWSALESWEMTLTTPNQKRMQAYMNKNNVQ